MFSIYHNYREPDILDPAWKESLCLTYGIEQVIFGNDTMALTETPLELIFPL